MIPFSPPRIDNATVKAVEEVLRSGWITTGPRTKEFERRLAAYIGVDRVLALNSWTNACELVLRWYGIGPGDEVILPAYTYCATANIVMHVGAEPVLVDVLDDFTIDPAAVRKAITSRTKCIIPVDVGGLPARVNELMRIAEEAKAIFTPTKNLHVAGTDPQLLLGRVLVLSDAAHSFGARIAGKPTGRQADITGYSFQTSLWKSAGSWERPCTLPPSADSATIASTFRLTRTAVSRMSSSFSPLLRRYRTRWWT